VNLSSDVCDTDNVYGLCSQNIERMQNDAVVTFLDGKHAALFTQKYNRYLSVNIVELDVNFFLYYYYHTGCIHHTHVSL
jgi:hypothetical protein